MRRKKQKHTRRTLRFYRINYGFRAPYKVLLDGNFVHALDAMKKGESKELVGRLLGDAIKCYTTPCVQHELKKLGKDFAEARRLLKRYPLHKCGHEGEPCSAADCLLAQLGDKNEEHFFVATQDRGLQRQCMAVPGGAVLFASVNGLHLEAPSSMQKQHTKQEEQRHQAPSRAELQSTALQEVAEARQQQQRDRPLIRRKKAKGPNPLSQLPKKKKAAAAAGAAAGAAPQQQQQKRQAEGSGGGDGGEGSGQPAKRKRQRRRGRGGGGEGGEGGGNSD